MEEKDFSSASKIDIEYDYVNETEMLKSSYFRDLLREKIRDALYEERKKNDKLDKILFDAEIAKFYRFKDKKIIPLETLTKMEDLIKLYSLIKDIFKKYEDAKIFYFGNIEDVKQYYHKYFRDLLTK